MYRAILSAFCICASAQYGTKEIALGAHLAGEFRKHNPTLENPAVETYLANLMHRIYPDRALTIQLYSSGSCGPVAFPGGHLFVPTFLFLESSDESELARKLSRSVERTLVKPARSSADGTPLIFVGGWTGNCPGTDLPAQKADTVADQRISNLQPSPEAFANAREIVRGLVPAEPVKKKPSLLRDR